LVIITPLWIILDPGMVSLAISIVFAIFGLIAFISPLIGVHNIMVREKDRLLDENAIQIEKTIEDLMIEVKSDRPERLSLADQKLSSLEKARLQIERISTWPWRMETLRQILAAIFLPIVIWLMQYFLAQLLGIPHATLVSKIEAEGGRADVNRELEGGLLEHLEMSLPAVIAIQTGINIPRYASLIAIRKAAKQEIQTIGKDEIDESDLRLNTHIEELFVPPVSKRAEILTGDPAEVSTKLAGIFKEKGIL
jgi:hypothetical protein